jgi:3-oxoacyl-[acyl-carrier protein] reductase
MSEKRVALVTGASRGIGAAIADSLVAANYELIGTATSRNGADQIEHNHPGHKGFVLDVMDEGSLNAFCDEINNLGLVPSIIVNNAGITKDNIMLRMKLNEWNDVMTANLNSVFLLTRHFLKPLVKQRFGRIINITSVVAHSGNAGQANYAAAKAGVVGFTKSLAREVASRGITVNAISPGFIDTDMTGKLTESQRDAALSQIPAGRMGKAKEIAAAVRFLASDDASYITGETLHINGGMHML